MTKLDRIKFDSREEAQAATIRKMVVAMAQDVRVLLIKLADRLHNVQTLGPLPLEKQERVARETIDVYAPLAHRLGVQEIKHEMENRCFEILYPKRHREIIDQIEQRAPEREALIVKAIAMVESVLSSAGIVGEVSGRPKQVYSIYRKMVDTGQGFENIHDLIGLRILTDDVKDCYAALGMIHSMWPPVQGRFKDYIAMPKFNFYQSLHTTVIGPDGKPLEVQIRSYDMHYRAEYGIAAHWRYKEKIGNENLPWLADLRVLQEEYSDPQEFLAHLKLDLYQDEVFVVTPRGDVISLPRGATPVDFAYTVHTEVGHRCTGAKVNGRLVALDSQLESGDIVEIITSRRSNGRAQSRLAGFRSHVASEGQDPPVVLEGATRGGSVRGPGRSHATPPQGGAWAERLGPGQGTGRRGGGVGPEILGDAVRVGRRERRRGGSRDRSARSPGPARRRRRRRLAVAASLAPDAAERHRGHRRRTR